IETIPSSIVASLAKFKKLPYLTIEEEARESVKVKF
ncbi:MAG: LemA family protein, partial [Spirochaetales bacterium]|nr:LemA family protein [Spirochaetales bacterium]